MILLNFLPYLPKILPIALPVIFALHILIPCLVYIAKAREKAEHSLPLDRSRNEDLFYLSTARYKEEMTLIAEPYVRVRQEEGYFDAKDGLKIHYAIFRQEDQGQEDQRQEDCHRDSSLPASKGGIVISHGYTESMEKYKELIYYFMRGGYNVYMMEHRGHGYSGRLVPELDKVHVGSFDDYVDDFCRFMDLIVLPDKGASPLFLYAHSMGGGIGTAVTERHPEYFDKVVLSSPMLDPDVLLLKPVMAFGADVACLLGARKKFIPSSSKGWSGKYDYDNVSFSSPVRYAYYLEKCRADQHLTTYVGTFGWLSSIIHGTDRLMKNKETDKLLNAMEIYTDEFNAFIKNAAKQ